MDEKIFIELTKRIEALKLIEFKYNILIKYIFNEANEIYFDKLKILKMIDILNGNETKNKEKNENEQSELNR